MDPSVLEAKWVEDAHFLYIGLGSVLRKRLHISLGSGREPRWATGGVVIFGSSKRR